MEGQDNETIRNRARTLRKSMIEQRQRDIDNPREAKLKREEELARNPVPVVELFVMYEQLNVDRWKGTVITGMPDHLSPAAVDCTGVSPAAVRSNMRYRFMMSHRESGAEKDVAREVAQRMTFRQADKRAIE